MRLSEIEALPGTKKGFFSRIAQPFSNVKAALDFKVAIKKAMTSGSSKLYQILYPAD